MTTWPTYDESKLVEATVEIVFQVNGKLRGKAQMDKDSTKEEMIAAALANEGVQRTLDGQEPKKVIAVPGKLVSVVM